ncbi:hypothetical protein [Metabacillus fastidiosus]|uniref:Uncharacterized protein n=1 Tax=Metabacillus fastidiosus TaxID=1458 RepID=A0ABU6NRM2_9BACI|nr:hypothetical protein [Metabacillus fastidiosus]
MTRDKKVSEIEEVTGYSFEYLRSLSVKEIDKLYRERVEKRG